MERAWTEDRIEPARAVAKIEIEVCDIVFATDAGHAAAGGPGRLERGGDAARVVGAAAERAARGERSAALIAAGEVLTSLEALSASSAARAPFVVHVVGGPPRVGRGELAAALDVGAGVVVSATVQEAVDITLAARRAVEDAETPLLHVCDVGAAGPAALPTAAELGAFLPRAQRAPSEARDDLDAKRAERSFTGRVPFALASAMRQLGDVTGRALGPFDRVDVSDAEEILVAYGSAAPPARDVCAAMRAEGRKVGLLAVRALRPFFAAECVKALSRARAVVVLEPLDAAMAPGGPLTTAVKVAFADALTWTPGYPGIGRIPPIVSVAFATLENGIRPADVRAAIDELAAGDRARRTLVFTG